MVLIQVDLRLSDVYFELWALEEHLSALEENIAFFRAQDRIRVEARLREDGLSDNEAEVQLAFQDHEQRVNHVLPRYLRGSFLVALWAVYEAAITEMADHFRVRLEIELRLKDLRGDFLERAGKYFDHILHRTLMPDEATAEALGRLQRLRNAFAHANGRLEAVNQNDLPMIRTYIATGLGISEDHGYLLLDQDFVRSCLISVNAGLRPLMEAVRAK